ncbi:MAG: cytochrome c [Blastocatellia bacterium]|nr:cytochrome c [Blastocatellia bacterium]
MKRKSRLLAIAGAMMFLASLSVSGNGDATPGAPVAARKKSLPTFSKDVAPIFYNKCVSCHREGEVAPMSLSTYKQARPWARAIREKVLDRSMPPWHADPAYGKFKNDRSLSKREIETITAWVDSGAKEGDPADLPPAPQFADGWQIGEPDLVLTVPFEYTVPAEGVLSYKYFMIPTDFEEDRWVQAAQIRPGNRAVVHT